MSEVIHHRAGDGRHTLPVGYLAIFFKESRHDAGCRFQPEAGTAGKNNRAHRGTLVTEVQALRVDRGCRTTTDVHSGRGPRGKVKHGRAGRTGFILGHTDVQVRKIKFQR